MLPAPESRPCYVNQKLIQPKDIFYALQRAAVGHTSDPKEIQGVTVPNTLNNQPWKTVVGYGPESANLLIQIELWFSDLDQKPKDALSLSTKRSLGLAVVDIPESYQKWVQSVLNSEKLGNGFKQGHTTLQKIRCFLAHQVTSIRIDSDVPKDQQTPSYEFLKNFYITHSRLDLFENVSDINFGLLMDKEEAETIRQILTLKEKVTGMGFEIQIENCGGDESLAFNLAEVFNRELPEDLRKRITRIYHYYKDIEHLPPNSIFKLFPNLTHFLLVTRGGGDQVDYESKVSSVLSELSKTKIKELSLVGVKNFGLLLTEISSPLLSIEKVNLSTSTYPQCPSPFKGKPIKISDVIRVFPKAKDVSIRESDVSVNQNELDSLNEGGVNATWERLYLWNCKSLKTEPVLNFWHPIFSNPNFKVSHNRTDRYECPKPLKILQAPTLDEIKNQHLHEFIINRLDQMQPQCKQ